MKKLSTHIHSFCNLMIQKGYDGHFHYNYENLGKLGESFQEYMLVLVEIGTHLQPFVLTTFYKRKHDGSPYMKCDFKIRYDEANGFLVKRMGITHGNPHVTIRTMQLDLIGNDEIPARDQAYHLISGSRERIKI